MKLSTYLPIHRVRHMEIKVANLTSYRERCHCCDCTMKTYNFSPWHPREKELRICCSTTMIPPIPLDRQDGERATSGGSRSQWHPKGLSQERLTFPNPEVGVGSSFRVLLELFFSGSENVNEFLECIENSQVLRDT
ncbi:hypothetical protein TNCV_4319271 [Trichonephila clavipes]|nr:hypothetical protein TNCV_4319271 [Trichonephila clavipes]